ncbi:MAG: hypothetical protein CMP25_03335 [Rickettsiales bacterium]|nr:hypothetical protein [Rickettsiales bacterium]|tara:strand:+ start:1621 stop:1848 length:228 start_codon:yes stop_codon:yes gene_type:complete
MKNKNDKIIQDVKNFLKTEENEIVHGVKKINTTKTNGNKKIDSESEIIKKEIREWLKLNAERISKELIKKKFNKD